MTVSIANGSEYVARAVCSTGKRRPVTAAVATPAQAPTTRATNRPRASSASPMARAGSTMATPAPPAHHPKA